MALSSETQGWLSDLGALLFLSLVFFLCFRCHFLLGFIQPEPCFNQSLTFILLVILKHPLFGHFYVDQLNFFSIQGIHSKAFTHQQNYHNGHIYVPLHDVTINNDVDAYNRLYYFWVIPGICYSLC